MRALVFLAVALAARGAAAQPVATPCAACARGDALIDQLSLEPLRALVDELAALAVVEPLTPAQYARVVELRRRTPAVVRLGAADDADLAVIAAALCRADTGTCTDATTRALRCLADRCEIVLPAPDPDENDILRIPDTCRPSREPKRSAPLGLGLEYGTGWQRSRYPADGRAWSFGIEARLRLRRRLGTVARIDRVAGRDEATDEDDNGHDDRWTGSITRIVALAGPSLVLADEHFEDEPRFLRVDLLGGYLSTRSQADESGPAAGIDITYQLWVFRFGLRFVQGFADASDATMLLGHIGVTAGSLPPSPRHEDCDPAAGAWYSRARMSRLALGLDFPLFGYGLSSDLGLISPGLGFELAWYLSRRFDAIAHADLLFYPGYERDRAIHHALLAGIRIDHEERRDDSSKTGFFSTVMAGYSHGAVLTPTSTGSGPIGELSFGWGIQADDAAGYFKLHGRFGVGPDNLDYRAIFLSGGFEIRFGEDRWGDRI